MDGSLLVFAIIAAFIALISVGTVAAVLIGAFRR